MANRRSSITAELKLSGAQGFKRELVEAGNSANKLGKQLQAIKPITFDGGANQAKRSFAMIEEHQRAHHRVLLRQHQATQARMTMSGGGGAGRGGKSGWGAAGNLAQGYNFVQDAAQGGIRGVANNIPWLIDAIASSTKVAALASGVAAAASVGLAAKMAYDLYQNTGDRFLDKAGTRHAINKMESDRKHRPRLWNEAKEKAAARGEVASERQAAMGGYADSSIAGLSSGEGAAAQESRLRDIKIGAIKDEAAAAKAMAQAEQDDLETAIHLNRQKAWEAFRIAQAEKESADLRKQEIDDELGRQSNAAPTQQEVLRRIELEKELVGNTARRAEADERAMKAADDLNGITKQEQAAEREKAIIAETLKMRLQAIEEEKKARQELIDQQETEGRVAQHNEIQKYRQIKKEADANLKEQEKARQTIRDQIKTEEDMAGMSPRKRAKAEEEEKRKARIESLKKEGFTSAEAGSIAAREEKLAKPRGNRIRGAGYGGEDGGMRGLGSETYGGLDDLAAMQPNRQERKTIRGAGAKPKEQNADKPETGWAMLVKAVQAVERAVKEGAPNRSERNKPLSTTSR